MSAQTIVITGTAGGLEELFEMGGSADDMTLAAHERVVGAILPRKPDRAEEAMAEHLTEWAPLRVDWSRCASGTSAGPTMANREATCGRDVVAP
ncbi:hypothetical protein ABZX95_50520 [Streptomyces sp. NPDC004232]|uniref:hypothetical protein n=1 Tax=Streptomyces sp. NPDC004232 TaxID=3154454 RepID=UPI0033BEB6DF